MVQAKTWILKQHFEGSPKDSDFELKLEQLSDPKDGGLCTKTTFHFLSTGYASCFLLIVNTCCRNTCGGRVPERGSLHAVSVPLLLDLI